MRTEFWARVDRSGGLVGCTPWTGAAYRGYGRVSVRVRTGVWRQALAHRVALRGHALPGPRVLHRCGNALCCNPGHLYEGTAAENMADARRHGTLRLPDVRGAANPASKLCPFVVGLIRSSALKARELAELFGVKTGTVHGLRAASSRTWRAGLLEPRAVAA